MINESRKLLEDLFLAGVRAVSGKTSVEKYCNSTELEKPDGILVIGKAAYAMYDGLPAALREDVPSLVITKDGHIPTNVIQHPNLKLIESSHPVPTEKSIYAGQEALEFIKDLTSESALLMLVSGGASALVEVLKDGYDLGDLVALNENSLATGEDIATINAKRSRLSLVKKGGLLSNFKGKTVKVLAISDVEGDHISIIGSGIGAAGNTTAAYSHHIVGSNEIARQAIAGEAFKKGLKVIKNQESLYGDINKVAREIFAYVNTGPPGLYIFGGEPTVKLPPNPGKGGRNQALVLLLARYIKGQSNLKCLVAGTDGTDGPTNAAGGYVDGETGLDPAIEDAIKNANSVHFLKKYNHQIITGPTGTNVMDIALILKK